MDLTTKAIIDLAKILFDKVQGSESVGETKDLAKIDKEAQIQALELQMAHAQAKVAQELAIAQRIENADEVILEEYYEGEAEGKLGVTGDEKGLNVGVAGSGRKVTKRVYRFVGGKKSGNQQNHTGSVT